MKVLMEQQTWWKRPIMLMLTFLLVLSSTLPVIGGPVVVQAADNTFYVSSDGNDDTNDGSESSPFATIEKAYEAITDNGKIVLLSDITLSKQLTLEDSKIVTIQSNDEKSIIRDENYKGILILVQGSADITFNDITIDGNEIAATNQGIYAKNGNVTFTNTEIKNHHIAANGGVAAIFAYGTGIVKIGDGTKIFDNKVIGMNEGNPSAVLLAGTGGQLIIEGGDIYHNTIEGNSNGPIVGVGSSGSPSFTMTGGKIRDNYLYGNGENSTGKTVGNVAVYMRGTASQAAFNFGGTAYVYDNKDKAGQQRNVFLNNTQATGSAYLNLIEAMEDDAKVGVFSNLMPTADAPIIDVAIGKDYTAIANDAGYFVSDKASSAEIKFEEDSSDNTKNKVILAPIPPTFQSAWLDQTDDNGKDITFTFNDEINLTDLASFTITVGGESVTPTFKVEGNRLILTLDDKPTGDIELNYAKDDGNLKGTNGMPVEDFDFIYEISHATDLEISEPNGDPAQVTESKPEIAGNVAAGSTVTVVIKDKDGNVVEDAGGVATVNADGTWLFTPSVDLAVGDYTIEVTATSADGKTAVTKLKRLEVQIEPPTDPTIVGPGGVTDKLISWVKAEESIVLNDENLVSELTDIVGQKSWEVSGSPRSTMSFNALNFNSGLQISSSYFTRTDLEPTVETEREAFSVQVGKSNGFPWEFGGGEASPFIRASYGANDQIKTYFGREAIVEANVAEEYFTNGALLNTWSATSDWALLLNGKELIAEDNNSTKFISEAQDRKYYIGAGHNSVYNGKITETILFDKQLTHNERNKVNSYLAIKYGITLNNGESDYVDTDEDVVWEVDTTYKNNIAGIARDVAEDLHQKQSQSVNEGVQVAIGLDALADTNANNSNTLTDKQYLIWADNGSDLTFSKAITGTTEKAHAERIWKVQNTDNVGEVQVAIPANAVDEDTTLLVSDSETFNLSNEKELEEIELNGVNYYGANVTLTNGQYFTFAAPAPKITDLEVEEVQATGDKIIVTFDKGVKLTDGTGFTVKIGDEEIILNDLTFDVDSTDPTKLIITLPTGTDVADKDVTVDYDGKGNLTGTNGVPVADFKEEIDAVKVTVTAPAGSTVTTGKPTFTGTATPGATVKVKISDNLTLEVEADENGDWSVTPNADLPDGDYNIEITAEKDGKTSTPVRKDLTIDTNQYVDYEELTKVEGINPDNVTYDKDAGKFKVPSNLDRFTFKDGDKDMIATKDAHGDWTITEADSSVIVIITEPEANKVDTAKPTFKGTATPGSTVKVKVSDTATLETTADANGNWSVTPKADLSDGDYNIEVTATKDGVTSTKDTKKLTIATVDKAQLQARADMSYGLTEGDYTSDSWTIYKDALDAAKNVLNNPNATQQEVDDAYNTLKNAQDALELTDSTASVDKSKLEAKVDDAAQLTEGDYTPDSWKNYMNALDEAEGVLIDTNATQQEVDQALEDLISAEKALEKKGGLSGLTPSTGTLSPSFKHDVYSYTMNVGNSTSEIDFSYGLFDETAKVTMTSNGVKVTDGKAPLKVGQNTIVIKVEDATGTKTYTITVNRANPSTGGGSGGSGGGVTPPTGPTTETIIVDLEVDGDNPVEKTPVEITRTTETDGTVSDRVELTLKQAQQAVDKALEIGNTIARIVLPDTKDEVDRATVEVPAQAMKLFKENGIDLQIYSNDALVTLPQTSMEGINDDFYFRLVPVKKKSEQQEIEARAKMEQVVKELMGSEDVYIVARPMTIETNLSSRPVTVTLPLRDVKMPDNLAERNEFLKQLGIYIEHFDGEKEVVFGEVVTLPNNELGLRISVNKFGTFTILNFGEDVNFKNKHIPYIKGFPDGTFKPEQNITRNQMALMIARNLGYVDGEKVTIAPFKDVSISYDGAAAIAFVKQLGIMNGDEKGNFRGSEQITRAQMAVVVANYMKLPVIETPITFTDTQKHWAKLEIEANRHAGVILGYEDGTFKPNANLTRAQAVKMINHMFERGPLFGATEVQFSDTPSSHWAFEEIVEAATTHTYTIHDNGQEWLVK